MDKTFSLSTDVILDVLPNGFLDAQAGATEIIDCIFNTSISLDGLIKVTGHENIQILNSSFERIIGLD